MQIDNFDDINPLTVVTSVLKETSKWKLQPEVVLLALKLVKDNPDIEEATAMLIARDEIDVASQMQAEKTAEEDGIEHELDLDEPEDTVTDALLSLGKNLDALKKSITDKF